MGKRMFVYKVVITCLYCLIVAVAIKLVGGLTLGTGLLISAMITLSLSVVSPSNSPMMSMGIRNESASSIDPSNIRKSTSSEIQAMEAEKRLRSKEQSTHLEKPNGFKDLFVRRTNKELITAAVIMGILGFIPYLKYFM